MNRFVLNSAQKGVLLWALDAKITGRSDAVHNARRVLLWLCTESAQDNDGAWRASYVRMGEMVAGLGMPKIVAYRALKRLLQQEVIREIDKHYSGSRTFILSSTLTHHQTHTSNA